MKRSIFTLITLLTAFAVSAQTLNVQVGSTIDQYTASSVGEMTYSGGTALNILNKSYNISDITKMYTDESAVTNNEVKIVYSGTTALVYVAGNVAQYVTPTINGAYVTIAQTNTEAVDEDEITYVLSGSATDGQFALSGSYKCTLSLAGVDLTCSTGSAINITNSKRIQISAKEGYTNTLTDCASGSQKACIYSKGQLQLQGKGTLNVVGNTKHGIKSASYISIKNLTLNITSAVGDAINCEEYFLMKSGTVTLSGMSDDGIQCDLDGTSTGETTDHEDEDSGNIYIEGGTLTISVTADAAKGIKADGDMVISDGTINVTNSGKYAYDDDDAEYKSSIGLKTDGNMTINGGTLTLKATGYAGKCIKCDSILTVTDGTITATATGSSNSTYGAAKAIKAGTATSTSSSSTNRAPGGGGGPGGGGPGGGGQQGGGGSSGNYTYSGGMVITGGTIIAKASSHEAIESKNTLEISGGYVYAESSDDAINSASHMTITGGYVMGNSTGNDGLDSNGNMYIKGGTVFAVATTQPEVGLDANTEGGYQLYITGGNVIAIGGLENGASVSTSKSSVSYSKGNWYAFKSGGTTQFSFKVPSNSSMGSSMVICSSSSPSVSKLSSTPSGTSIWNGYGVIN